MSLFGLSSCPLLKIIIFIEGPESERERSSERERADSPMSETDFDSNIEEIVKVAEDVVQVTVKRKQSVFPNGKPIAPASLLKVYVPSIHIHRSENFKVNLKLRQNQLMYCTCVLSHHTLLFALYSPIFCLTGCKCKGGTARRK